MADELVLNCSLSFLKGSTEIEISRGLKVTVSGNSGIQHRQTVGTAEEALVLGEVTVGGFLLMVNRDATNYVKVRSGSGLADLVRLKPGEPALFRVDSGATPYVIADTAPCDVEYVLIED